MSRSTRVLTLLAAVLIAAGAFLWWQGPSRPGGSPLDTVTDIVDTAATGEQVDTSRVVEMALGRQDAPVTVVEYASFTCPHCRNFHERNFARLKAEYIDTGKVRFVLREVYFDRFGLWAGMLARCKAQDPERYFAMVDLIFGRQREWARGETAAEIVAKLKALGRASGLSDADIDACLNDLDMAKAMVAVYQKNATADGVQGTPTFLINGKKVSGDMTWEDFRDLIEQALNAG
ncbi:MAG: DsbA family protein [Alphaproteobacteria bacterium]|nr:MAG: DsbA family protein [Alphaproteobacteria bacterium]